MLTRILERIWLQKKMPTKLLIGCADSDTFSPCHASFAHRFLVPHCDASIVRELGHRNWRSKKPRAILSRACASEDSVRICWIGSGQFFPVFCRVVVSWHKNKLKKYLGTWVYARLRISLRTMFEAGAKFTSSWLKNAPGESPATPDVPRAPFPDRTLLFEASGLTKAGRTSADQFFRGKSFDVRIEGDITYMGMPQTLARYDAKKKCWFGGPNEPLPAANLFRLVRA